MKLTRSRVGDRDFSNLGSWLQIAEIKSKGKEENKGKEGLGRRRREGERGKTNVGIYLALAKLDFSSSVLKT